MSPEKPETESTVAELVEACKEALDEEMLVAIQEIEDFGEALDFTFTCLIEAGVEDPEAFLIEKGILEESS